MEDWFSDTVFTMITKFSKVKTFVTQSSQLTYGTIIGTEGFGWDKEKELSEWMKNIITIVKIVNMVNIVPGFQRCSREMKHRKYSTRLENLCYREIKTS